MIMKKEYISPEAELVYVESQVVLAAESSDSVEREWDEPGGGGGGIGDDGGQETGGPSSKSFNLWED